MLVWQKCEHAFWEENVLHVKILTTVFFTHADIHYNNVLIVNGESCSETYEYLYCFILIRLDYLCTAFIIVYIFVTIFGHLDIALEKNHCSIINLSGLLFI